MTADPLDLTRPGGPRPTPSDWLRRYQRALLELSAGPMACTPEPPPEDREAALAEAQAPLMALLEAHGAWARADPSADLQAADEVRYAMAVYADEMFTTLEWSLRPDWGERPLELRLFGTTTGARTVLERIEALIARADPGRADMGRFYLLLLALGFRGALADPARVAGLRARLQACTLGETPAARSLLTPRAYGHTLSTLEPRGLPDWWRWGWAAAGAFVLLVVLSYPLWRQAVAPLEGPVAEILHSG